MTGAGRRYPYRLHSTVQSFPSIQDRLVVGIEAGTTDDLLAVGYFDLRGKPFRKSVQRQQLHVPWFNQYNTGSPYAQFILS